MNRPIAQAADLLQTNWCVGDLHEVYEDNGVRVDKYCALGALAYTTDSVVLTEDEQHWDDGATYQAVNIIPQTKALAIGILASGWFKNLPKGVRKNYLEVFVDEDYKTIVYEFNDSQSSNKKIIKLFREVSEDTEV